MRRLLPILFVLLLALPAGAQVHSRTLHRGQIYLGTAPGFAFGGRSIPRSYYMDLVQVGYVLPSGLDFSYMLTGHGWFPDEGDYSISLNRFAIGWRPFLEDPLPMIQPYLKAGGGFGGEGRYLCEPRPKCDPAKEECTDSCGRANWVGSFFVGGGIDFTSRLFDIGNQQLLLYIAADIRYETLGTRFQSGVVSFPVGLKLF